jgi:hypothetical protein
VNTDLTTAADTPYVAVGTDPATGRAIIGLDHAAGHALLDLLDLVDTKDLTRNPDSYSVDPDTAAAAAQVADALRGPLGRLLRR